MISKKLLATGIGFLFLFTMIFGQKPEYKEIKIKRRNFLVKDEGKSEAWQSIKDGDDYFEEGLGTFHLALENYFNAYDYNASSAPLNYKIGICFLYTGKSRTKAIEHLEKAYEIDKFVSPDITYQLARAYHLNMEFDKAIEEYDSYLNSLDADRVNEVSDRIAKRIKECKHGKILTKDPIRCIIRNLGPNINSQYDDYNPVFNSERDKLYFTSRRKGTTGEERFELDNKFKEDIYVAKKTEDGWQNAYNLKELNTDNNDAALGLYKNGRKLYIYNGDENGGDILVTEIEEGEWSKPDNLAKKIRSDGRETTMDLTSDKRTIYFVALKEDKEERVGGKDIFVAHRNNEGEWQEPSKISPNINSKYNEEAVHLHPSGDTLFFSSEGHNSMGGYDIFMTHKDNSGQWSEPENLGYPINTPEDDLFYKTTDNPNKAYLSSVRDEGIGGKDIYKIMYIGEEKDTKLSGENELIAWSNQPKHELFYKEPELLSIDSTLYMKGTITDADTAKPLVAKLQLIDKDKSKTVAKTISNEDGSYKIKIPEKKSYGVEINSKGYMFFAETINFKTLDYKNNVTQKDFELNKVEVGAKMVLKNIYFETAKSTLKSESFEELNRVVKFMQNNPSVRIEISGHTDNRGSYSYNKELSEERAKSVVNYLTSHGIKEKRMDYKGYSYEQPIAPNDTPEGRAQNRRVEFKILETD